VRQHECVTEKVTVRQFLSAASSGASLQTRLALALCGAATLPLVVAFALTTQHDETTATLQELTLNRAVAEGIARDTGRLLDGNEQAAVSIANVPGLLDYPPETQTSLLSGLTMVPPVRGWATFDAGGRAIARSDGGPLTDLSAEPIYDNVRSREGPIADVSAAPPGVPPLVRIAVAIRGRAGQLSGMLVLETDQITQTLFSTVAGQGARLYLVDQVGRVLAEPTTGLASSPALDVSSVPLGQALLGSMNQSGTLAYQSRDQQWLAGYSGVPGFGWIVVERPSIVALADVYQNRDALVWVLMIAAVLAMVAGVLVAGWLARPLTVLAAAVKHLGSDGPDAPLPRSHIAEVTLLADNFIELRDRLTERSVQRERAETELRRSEESFRLLFASNPQPMWVYKQPTLEFLEVNAAATASYGYTRAEFLTMRLTDIRTPAESVRLLDALGRGDQQTLTHGASVHRFKDGQLIDVEVAAHPLSFGGVEAALGVVFDVTARKRAEMALRILAQASEVLGGSLDYEATLRQVARLAVPALADWCVVHVVTADNEPREVEVAHVDPAKLELARDLQRRYPPEMTPESGVGKVMSSGESELIVDVSDEMLAAAAQNAEHLLLLRQLGLSSAMIVPMRAQDKVLGAITLVYAESGRHYAASDLSLAEDLARRCGQAIENSLLYRVARDAEAELRHQLDFTRALAESLGEGVYATDEDGRLTFVNPAGQQILGWGAGVLGMKNTHDRVHAHQRNGQSSLTSYLGCALVGTPGTEPTRHVDDDVFTREDGTLVPVSYSTSPIVADGRQVGTVVAFRDVTERKRAEQEILGLNADLEQRVIERTTELKQANQELESFAYTVAHDLRAPLCAMDGFSRILMEGHADGLADEGRRYLRIVRDNAQQMGRLIDDLLAFSRLGRQGLTKQAVRPDKIARQALIDLASEQMGRRVDVTIADLPECQADPSLLRQVFVNLLSNALKYSRTREVTRIDIGNQYVEREQVYWVRDNGVGFNMRYAEKLFGVFQRLHRAEDYEGTGVGLALVQRIVQRHGGRIWAESAPDEGATFYFTVERQSEK
jgi:PAS domain S-box-containing protein